MVSFLESNFEHIHELIYIKDRYVSSEGTSVWHIKFRIGVAVVWGRSPSVLNEQDDVDDNKHLNAKNDAIDAKVSTVFVDVGRDESSSRDSSKQEDVQQSNSGGSGPGACDVCHVGVHANEEDDKSSKDSKSSIDE